jgi:hypothetical protein
VTMESSTPAAVYDTVAISACHWRHVSERR